MSSRTDKYARMSDQLNKAKQQRIKDVQDEWKSQFVDPKSQLQQLPPSLKKPAAINSTVLHEGDEEGAQADPLQLQRQYDQEYRRQKYAEVDGRKIYLAGLDLKLLQEQKQQLNQQRETDRSDLLHRISQKVKIAESVNKVAHNKLYREMVGRMFNHNNEPSKPKLDLNSYFVFDVDADFGRAAPQIVIKRLGKFHKHPLFPGISSEKVHQLAEMIERNTKRRELMAMFSMVSEQQPKQQPAANMSDEDSDDIFSTNTKVAIEVGRKLDFKLQQESASKLMTVDKKLVPEQPIDFDREEEELLKAQRLRKKRKLMQDQLSKPSFGQNDSYSECYWNTGPSLEQTKKLKQQGIVIQYDDYKEFKRPQRRQNLNKQYEKIKRVIAEKEKKPN